MRAEMTIIKSCATFLYIIDTWSKDKIMRDTSIKPYHIFVKMFLNGLTGFHVISWVYDYEMPEDDVLQKCFCSVDDSWCNDLSRL